MITRIRHTALMVTDMDKALAFYRDLLGLIVVRDAIEEGIDTDGITGLPGAKFREVKLSTTDSLEDGCIIELTQMLTPLGATFYHTALQVDNIEKEYKRLSEKGVVFSCPPFISLDGYAKITCCYDPDGHALELVELL